MADWPYLGNSRIIEDGSGVGRANADSGSANTKGSWVEISAALASSISGIMIELHNHPAGYQVIDIGIGASGSEIVVVPDLRGSQGLSGTHANMAYFVPLSLPAGTRVAIRSQSSAVNGFMRVKCQFLSDAFAGLQAPTRYENWGFVAATTKGTQFTNGNGAKGSWTQIIAATSFTTKWLFFHLVGDTVPVDMWVDFGIGAAASEVVILPNVAYTVESLTQAIGPVPLSIPAGTRVAVRGQSNGGTCTAHITAGG